MVCLNGTALPLQLADTILRPLDRTPNRFGLGADRGHLLSVIRKTRTFPRDTRICGFVLNACLLSGCRALMRLEVDHELAELRPGIKDGLTFRSNLGFDRSDRGQ